MPQIRCPKCGLIINLENRRSLDVKIITEAVKRGSKTFTSLLRTTGLPRKTLNLRLKELCERGVLVKVEGHYQLNGSSEPKKNLVKSFERLTHNERFKGVALLLLLLIGLPAFSYAMIKLTPTTQVTSPKPEILGTYTVVVEVNNINNLYAWQILMVFNESELTFLEARKGEIAGDLLVNASDIGDGALLLGGSLMGNVPGIDVEVSTSLTYIVFGYYVEDPEPPQIAMKGFGFETFLLDSELNEIPIASTTLNLRIQY